MASDVDDRIRFAAVDSSKLRSKKSSAIDGAAVVTPASSSSAELIELLCRLQSSRLDDQRCSLPNSGSSSSATSRLEASQMASKNMLQDVLKHPPPYPMIVLPPFGGYRIEPTSSHSDDPSGASFALDHNMDETSRIYRAHFLGYEHFNYFGYDQQHGPVLMSLKVYGASGGKTAGKVRGRDSEDATVTTMTTTPGKSEEKCARVLVRLSSGTKHRLVYESQVPSGTFRPLATARLVAPELSQLPPMEPAAFPKASELVAAYDEHTQVDTYKFGLLYQKVGQVTEEAIFGNRSHSPAMDEFMRCIGRLVSLSEHQGYRGGLDTKFGHTGNVSLYETFNGREIMFHVSTLLPHSDHDPQQLQKKCHVGNDIVAVVFQDGNTPFCPDMIASHFLHAFVVVQPLEPCSQNTRYKVSVVSRQDVPPFGPPLSPGGAIFHRGPKFKEFLLSKLINAEAACYKSKKFAALHQRTRAALLSDVVRELRSLACQELPGQLDGDESPADALIAAPPSASMITKLTRRALGTRPSKGQRTLTKLRKLSPTMSAVASKSPASSAKSECLAKRKAASVIISTTDSGHGDSDHSLSSSSPRLENNSQEIYTDDDESDVDEDEDDFIDDSVNEILKRSGAPPGQTGTHLPPMEPACAAPTIVSLSSISTSSASSFSSSSSSSLSSSLMPPRIPVKPSYVLVPECQNVVSGAVTTITVCGDMSGHASSQLTRLQDEVARLKMDKLELLRQIMAVQHEVRRLQERETQLQSDLSLAGREIRRLKTFAEQVI